MLQGRTPSTGRSKPRTQKAACVRVACLPCVLVTTILLLETNEEEKREGKTEVVEEREGRERENGEAQ